MASKKIAFSIFALAMCNPFSSHAERPEIIWTRAGHSQMVMSTELTADGAQLFSSSYDGTAKFWNFSTGEMLYSFRAHGPGALSPNGEMLAIQTGGAVQVRRATDGVLLRTVTGGNFARPAWSPDSQRVIAASNNTALRITDVSNGQSIFTLTGHTGFVRCAAYSPDGTFVVSGAGMQGTDNTARIWSASTGQQLRILTGHTEYVGCVAVSPDSTIVASGSGDHTVKLWQAASGAMLRTLTGSDWAVWDVSFSPDGQKIAAATIGGPIRIWNVADGVEQPAILLTESARTVRFSSDGASLLIGCQYGSIEQRSFPSGEFIRTIGQQNRELGGVMISDDARTIAFGHDNLKVTRLRARDGFMIDQQTLSGYLNQNGTVFSHDVQSAAVLRLNDTSTQLWNLESQSPGLTLSGHVSVIFASAFSPDGTLFATAGEYQAGLWNVATGAFIHWFQDEIVHSHAAVAFSTDGMRIALTDRGHAKVFDVATAALLHDFTTGLFELSSVAFSPDGSTLAAAGTDQFWAWNLATNSVAWNTTTTIGRASGLCYSRDGQRLFLSGRDGLVQIRRASNGTILRSYDQETGIEVTALSLSPTERTFAYTRSDATIVVARNPFWTSGDIDGDGCVTLSDLSELLSDFGRNDEPALTDLNDDGATDLSDLTLLLSNFGACNQ